MERGRIQGLPKFFWVPPIISGKGTATDFKFGRYIYRAYPNKSPLTILQKRERGRIQGLPKFFGYPLLSQELVKLRTSNFVGTFIGWVGTKAHENVGNSGRGHSQGVPKIFSAPICREHCAVIFAIAQLSCTFYYRAKLRIARYCLSVRLSVCPSVCDVEVSWSHTFEFCKNNFTAD